ncbi:MAG: lipopolysaccharide biosynthesis protein [Bacteroidales bacterium]|jgi:teichuronic acid exporter|nr:lipopolysaccharide biosynthesis protein [Bacteroidales bacterium]HHT52830.1 lipopolysaccharide biosynthesis protein [Bacteroidales bacterium]
MGKSLKQHTIAGMVWSSIGKFGTLGISFLSNIILARILMPEDFGMIGMLYIFLAISQTFINGGLGTALVQRKEPTHIDYSTVFYWNLSFAIFFVIILYFTSPLIAQFYRMAELKNILRVQSIILIINSFSLVPATYLQKNLRFKELSVRNIIAALIGMIAAVSMAYSGFGVWSLVYSNLLAGVASVILLWRMSSWRPTWEFSFESLKSLFSFGGLILLSTLVETIYVNIQGLIIGKAFSATKLGYYTQAKKLEEVPSASLSSIVNEVSFPVFSKLQDDRQILKRGVQKSIKSVVYLNFPLMVLLIVIAHPLFILLYTAKWETSVPYFQILCLGSMLYTLNTVNTNVIKSLGKGNIYFILQFSKRLIGVVCILLSVRFGIEAMLWTIMAMQYVFFFVNAVVNGKLIGYGLWEQIKDVIGSYLLAAVAGVVVYFALHGTPLNEYLIMIMQIILFALIYFGASALLKMEGFLTYKEIIMNVVRSKFKKFKKHGNTLD